MASKRPPWCGTWFTLIDHLEFYYDFVDAETVEIVTVAFVMKCKYRYDDSVVKQAATSTLETSHVSDASHDRHRYQLERRRAEVDGIFPGNRHSPWIVDIESTSAVRR